MKHYLYLHLKFDSIIELIEYYHQHPIRTVYFSHVLTIAVPKIVSKDNYHIYNCFTYLLFFSFFNKDDYKARPWFSNISDKEAEDMLKKVPLDGAFLVHPSSEGSRDRKNGLILTFR